MKYIAFLLGILLLVSSVYGVSCTFDAVCSSSGDFCDETNKTSGISQCSDVNTTGCDSIDISCSQDSDCAGISNNCDETRGICYMDFSGELGDRCQLDKDCESAYCMAGLCSYNPPHSCSSNIDCTNFYGDTTHFCNIPYGLCQAKRKVGGSCGLFGQCEEGLICDFIIPGLGICQECTDSWAYDDTHFCNLNNTGSCGYLDIYPNYAEEHSLPYNTIDPKKGEGETCNDDACCISNNCVDGYCISGLNPGVGGSYTSKFCDGSLDYSLNTHYYDGASPTNPGGSSFDTIALNYTNIRTLFGVSDLRAIRDGIGTSMYLGRYSDANEIYTKVMFGFYYSNDTGTMCYGHQQDQYFYGACFDSCLASGLAENISSTSWYNNSIQLSGVPNFQCVDNNSEIVIIGHKFGNKKMFMAALHNYDANGVEVLSFVSNENKMGVGYYDTSWHYKDVSTTGGSHTQVSGATTNGIAVYPYSWCTAGDNDCEIDFSNVGSIAPYVQLTTNPYTRYSAATFSEYLDRAVFSLVSCCQDDGDCNNGWCCISNSCTPCGIEAEDTVLLLTSEDVDDIGCYNDTILLMAQLSTFNYYTGQGTYITDDIEITFEVEGAGSVSPTVCNLLEGAQYPNSGCFVTLFTDESGAEVVITATSEATDDYDSATASLTIDLETNCHWLSIQTYSNDGHILKNVQVCPNGLTCQYSAGNGLTYWGSLPPTPTSYNVSVSKTGWQSGSAYIPFDNYATVILYPNYPEGTPDELRENFEIDVEPPTDVRNVTQGVLSMFYTFSVTVLPWFWYLIFFIILIGIAYLIIVKVPSKFSRGVRG